MQTVHRQLNSDIAWPTNVSHDLNCIYLPKQEQKRKMSLKVLINHYQFVWHYWLQFQI